MATKKLKTIRTAPCANPISGGRLSWQVDQMAERILRHLERMLAREPVSAEKRDWWQADVYAVRDRILERFIKTQRAQHEANCRRVYYLSMEYLMGRLLRDSLHNCELFELNRAALQQLGLRFEEVEQQEEDMGLGNGGLGRLAACFLDSLATLNLPAVGYGMHYEFGMFRQQIENFQQRELADNWLAYGNPWPIMRPENVQRVRIYGHVESRFDGQGNPQFHWLGGEVLRGIPWDIPIVGHGAETVNFLRLWECRASNEFDLQDFNRGNFLDAVHDKARSETISKILYPNDASDAGKALRLIQQYFFVCCSLKDIIRRHFNGGNDWTNFCEKICIQLNDTHPAIAIAELMRILLDDAQLGWTHAWEITTRTFAYTNHTLLPEALERWSVALLGKALPRHLQIIEEINRRFLLTVQERWPGDSGRLREMSFFEDGFVRMGHLAVVGSFSVNGVAAMHSQLVKSVLFPGFHQLFPKRFSNKTNGITPRRWIRSANPRLTQLINQTIGTDWITNLEELRRLEAYANDLSFRDKFARVKLQNKIDLANFVEGRCAVSLNPNALFDVHIKRIHEYKRQHLNLLHILTLYHRLLNGMVKDAPSRVFLFGGKAAPGYAMAKTIIHAINMVADRINGDTAIGEKLKVVFVPNYDVSSAMVIIPAADLSEQISAAGTEASGTGNMKLALNGALTIGTLDGANVEILEEIGANNLFIFGHTAMELELLRRKGYNPRSFYEKDDELSRILDWMLSGSLDSKSGGADPVRRVAENLLAEDRFYVLADYRKYVVAQELASNYYLNSELWYAMAILTVARMGKFSSDRTIREYAKDIWHLSPLSVP